MAFIELLSMISLSWNALEKIRKASKIAKISGLRFDVSWLDISYDFQYLVVLPTVTGFCASSARMFFPLFPLFLHAP